MDYRCTHDPQNSTATRVSAHMILKNSISGVSPVPKTSSPIRHGGLSQRTWSLKTPLPEFQCTSSKTPLVECLRTACTYMQQRDLSSLLGPDNFSCAYDPQKIHYWIPTHRMLINTICRIVRNSAYGRNWAQDPQKLHLLTYCSHRQGANWTVSRSKMLPILDILLHKFQLV